MRRALALACLASCAAPQDPSDPPPAVDDSDPPPTDTAPFPTDDRSRLSSTGVRLCADPGDRRERGAFVRRTDALTAPATQGRVGVAAVIADLDGVGELDVVLVDPDGVRLHANAASTPDGPLVALHDLLPGEAGDGPLGALAADLDEDGDLDLLITGPGVGAVALRNDGGGAFVDVTDTWGLNGLPHAAGASQGDVDGDGTLELFIGGRRRAAAPDDAAPSVLLRWDGARFQPGPPLPDVATDGQVQQGAFVDADQDGDADLVLVRTAAPGVALLRNVDGAWVAAPEALPALGGARGLAVGDLDHDGDEDLVVAMDDALVVLEGSGGGWVAAAAPPALADDQTEPWGPELVDLDHDGRLDILAPMGWLDERPDALQRQPDALFAPAAGGGWVDRATAQAVDDGAPNRAALVGDLNGDGWPDLLRPGLDGVARYDLSRCGEASWVTLHLRQPGANPFAVGAQVAVTAGGVTRTATVRAGGTSYAAGDAAVVTIGLGAADVIEGLDITWPDGLRETWTQLAGRQELTVTRR